MMWAGPKRVDHRTVSELRAAKASHKKKIPQMSREAFEKMEQTGRFPDKMMEAIKKGQKWYQEDLKKVKMAKAGKGAAQKNERKNNRPEFTRKEYHFAQ